MRLALPVFIALALLSASDTNVAWASTPDRCQIARFLGGAREEASFTVHASRDYQLTLTVPVRRASPLGALGRRVGKSVVTLSLNSRAHCGTGVSYETAGHLTRKGIAAHFGKLGRVAVTFKPQGPRRRVRTCRSGAPLYYQPGVYIGIIRFHGERNFSSASADVARGFIGHPPPLIPKTACSAAKAPVNPGKDDPIQLTALALRHSGNQKAAAAGFIPAGFVAYAFGSGQNRIVSFRAFVQERRGRVSITRHVKAIGTTSQFSVSDSLESAEVNPTHGPFSGSGAYGRGEDGATWTGSLAAEFVGRGRVPLVGPAFSATLISPDGSGVVPQSPAPSSWR